MVVRQMAKTNAENNVDKDLVRRFQAGDETAFTALYEFYKNPALRSAYLITGNYCDSENVLQETFLKCYQNLPRLKEPASFKAWFYRILTRTAWEYCYKRDKETPAAELPEALAGRPADTALDDRLAAAETQAALLAAVDKLPLKQKTVVILYYYNELSVQEIARVTGSLAGTVKSRLFTARGNLAKELKREFGLEVNSNELQIQAK